MAAAVSLPPLPWSGVRHRLEAIALAPGEIRLAIVRVADAAKVGEVVLTDGETPFVRCLLVDETQRGYGAGSEAAWLLLDALAAAGCERVEAWAPPQLGLAVYFWSRMGFAPCFGARGEGLHFERRLR